MPYFVTIALAMAVACLISWDAPVVISSKIISSATRPPRATVILCSIFPLVLNISSFSGWGMVYPAAPGPVGITEMVYTGSISGRTWNKMACPVSWYAVIFFSFSEMILLFFSVPIPTLIKASLMSSCFRKARSSLAACMAASFRRFSSSAPVKPAVVWAICFRFTSSPRGFPLACTARISSRPCTSGTPTAMRRSKRPGRRMAGSRISTRLVAAITMIPSLTPKPSISTSSWFSVCSRSSWPPPIPVPRIRATASISSIKIIQGALLLASSKRSLTLEAPTPTNISTKSDPEIEKNGTPASPATALASRVFPVPGGPTSSTPLGILAPTRIYF